MNKKITQSEVDNKKTDQQFKDGDVSQGTGVSAGSTPFWKEAKAYIKAHIFEIIVTSIIIPGILVCIRQYGLSIGIQKDVDRLQDDYYELKANVEKYHDEYIEAEKDYIKVADNIEDMSESLDDIKAVLDKIRSDLYRPQIRDN